MSSVPTMDPMTTPAMPPPSRPLQVGAATTVFWRGERSEEEEEEEEGKKLRYGVGACGQERDKKC